MTFRILNLLLAMLSAASLALAQGDDSTPSKQTADDFVYQARVAAGDDRHREAIDSYLRAIAIDPDLRATISIELGHQYTWAEIPDSAIIWYTRHLADNPGDMEASLGLARAMSWADDLYGAEDYYLKVLPESKKNWINVLLGLARVMAWQEDRHTAQEIYDYVLMRRPDNLEARLGLAKIMNWSSKHRRARDLYLEVLEEEPDNAEAHKGLAEAYYWMGRHDLALEVISCAEPNEELQALAATIEESKRPRGGATYRWQKNTSDGEYQSLVFTGTIPTGYRTRITPGYLLGNLTKQNFPTVRRHRLFASFEHRFDEAWYLTAAPGVELNGFDAIAVPPGTDPVDDFNLFVWDVFLTVTPRDWLRLDAGNSRETMPIPETIYRRIDVITTNLGLDWRIKHRVITFWNAAYSSYSDGNGRLALAHRGEWKTPVRLPYRYLNELTLIEGIDYFNFAKQLDNGYFNPSTYWHPYLGFRFVTNLGRRVRFSFEGVFGAERDSGTGWASVGSFDTSLRFRVVGATSIIVGAFRSGSRLTAPDGFRAEGAYATIDVSW
ncbi:MAG: tetratricopeptide repeat protein [Candidatus Latescibacterota bacterium]|nr:MAG: tetratricopeptide repeat protein [Candidatus Latescibacterota bacterium]